MALERRTLSRLDLTCAACLVIAAYAVAACKLAALSWDGSWYFFRTLQDGTPFIPHTRYGTYPILFIIVRASKFIHDPGILGACYGLILALIPVGSLALSWFFLRRDEHAPLRVWPALGILLTALPGQLCLMSEGTLVAQLLWPILALIATGPAGIGGSVWLVILAVTAALLHPTSVLIFVLAAVLFAWRAWREPGGGKGDRRWAAVFIALTLGKSCLTYRYTTDYERSQFSFHEIHVQFMDSVMGYPLMLLGLTYLLGFILLAPSNSARRLSVQGCCVAVFVPMLVAGWWWAGDAAHWLGLLDYRRFVLPAMLPLAAMALRHFRMISATPLGRQPFPPILSGIALVFAVVLVTQSVVWGSLLTRFSNELARRGANERFVTAGELPFIRRTPLKHWTACPLSILLQSQRPQVIFAARPEDVHPESVQVNRWEEISLQDSWFILEPFRTTDPDAR